MSDCLAGGDNCGSKNCADGCKAQEIKDLGDGLAEGITFSIEAAADLSQVPKMFRKMALKTIIKSAKAEDQTEISREFALKFKP